MIVTANVRSKPRGQDSNASIAIRHVLVSRRLEGESVLQYWSRSASNASLKGEQL